MIKKLDFLESSLPESIFLLAEEILEKDVIEERESQVKNLRLFTSESYEVEVLTTPTYIKSYTCECDIFVSEGLCEHIGAALLAIRRKRTEKTQKKKQPAKRNNLSKRLSIDAIIKHIDPDILMSFIKEYAKKNSKFDTALKVHFARRVPLDDAFGKYKYLLDKILKPLAGVDEKYSIPSINAYVKHSQEIVEQFKDALSLENYTEAATILTLLIRKTSYALLHTKAFNEGLENLNNVLHKQVKALLKSDIAPELRNTLANKLVEISALSYYRFNQINNNVVFYLLEFGNKEIVMHTLSNLLGRVSQTSNKELQSDIIALIIFGSLKENLDYSEIIKETTLAHLQRIVAHLLKLGAYNDLESFIEKAKTIDKWKGFQFSEVEIILARKRNDDEALLPLLAKKYVHSKSKNILDEILEMDISLSAPFLEIIRRSIQDNIHFAKSMLRIYAATSDFDLMIDYVVKHDLYQYMDEYMNKMFGNSPALVEMYIRRYLDKSSDDIFYAHRNQIHVLRNVDVLENASVSNQYLNTLRSFKSALEEAEMD